MRIRLRPPTDLHKSVKPQRPTRYGPSRQLTRQFGGHLAETGRVDVLYYFGPYVYRSTSARMRERKGRMSRPTAECEFWGRGETRAVGLGNAVNFPGDPEIRGCVCGKVFYRAMLCMRGTSHGPVSVRPSQQVGVLLKRLNVG